MVDVYGPPPGSNYLGVVSTEHIRYASLGPLLPQNCKTEYNQKKNMHPGLLWKITVQCVPLFLFLCLNLFQHCSCMKWKGTWSKYNGKHDTISTPSSSMSASSCFSTLAFSFPCWGKRRSQQRWPTWERLPESKAGSTSSCFQSERFSAQVFSQTQCTRSCRQHGEGNRFPSLLVSLQLFAGRRPQLSRQP